MFEFIGFCVSCMPNHGWRTGRLAKAVGLSPSRLKVVFGQETGMSIQQYSMQLRLQCARDLLLFTDLPIKDVRIRSGIPNGPNFVREFKKRFNATPSMFRRLFRSRFDERMRNLPEIKRSEQTKQSRFDEQKVFVIT